VADFIFCGLLHCERGISEDQPYRLPLLKQHEAANDGAKPAPPNYGAWLAKPERKQDPAPVARPRRRARAQQEPSEPPAFEPEPGESYDAALRRLLGDESQERLAARAAELADSPTAEPEPAPTRVGADHEAAKPEPWWSPWLAWWRER
jgi:hypothetical protein